MSTYEVIEGTEPSEATPHEARTIKRTELDDTVYMMTEIEDGVFVQWGECRSCDKRIDACGCKGGPTMPHYIAKWRDERFEKSIRHRRRSEQQDEDEFPEDPDNLTGMDLGDGIEPAKMDDGAKADALADEVDAGLSAALEALRKAKETHVDPGF